MDLPPPKSFSRALPHRSPDDIAAEFAHTRRELQQEVAELSARLRRRSVLLAGTTIFASLLTVTIVVLALNWPVQPPAEDTAAVAAANVVLAARQPSPNLSVSKKAAPNSAINDSRPPSPSPSTTDAKSPAEATRPAAEAPNATNKEVYLEVLGGLSAAHLYQSYLTIGLLADGVESKAYSLENARKALATVTTCMSLVEGKLSRLSELDLDADDKDSLERLKTVTALLRLQTRILDACWSSGRTQPAEQYQQARQSSWTALSKVLGLEGK
jgi:hypothetical protein